MVSPACEVNSASLGGWTATTEGVNVAAGETVSIRLADSSGARFWQLQVLGTDEQVVAPTLTVDTSAKTATFTAPTDPNDGWALILESKVGVMNLGLDRSGAVQSSYTTTFGVYLLTPTGNRVGALNETTEGDSAHGWLSKHNPLLRRTSAAAVDIRTYGATTSDPTGATNAAAIAAAFAASKHVVIPIGTFKVNAPITTPAGAHMIGQGPGSVIDYRGTGFALTYTNATGTETSRATYRNFKVLLASSATGAVNLVSANSVELSGLWIDGQGNSLAAGAAGIRLTCAEILGAAANCANVSIRDCRVTSIANGTGIQVYYPNPGIGAPIAATSIEDCIIDQNAVGIDWDTAVPANKGTAGVLSLTTTIVQSNSACGMTGSFLSCQIRGCHFENGATAMTSGAHIVVDSGQQFYAMQIDGSCVFTTQSATQAYCIDLSPGTGIKGNNLSITNSFLNKSATAGIRLQNVQGAVIGPNRYGNMAALNLSQTGCTGVAYLDGDAQISTVNVRKTTAVDYTASNFDEVIQVTASGKTITLPGAATWGSYGGKVFTVVNLVAATDTTIAATGSDTILGASSVHLRGLNASVTLVAATYDGTHYVWLVRSATDGELTYSRFANVGIGTAPAGNMLKIDSGASPTDSQIEVSANGAGSAGMLVAAVDDCSILFDLDWDAGALKARSTAVGRFHKTDSGRLYLEGLTTATIGNTVAPVQVATWRLNNGALRLGDGTQPTEILEVNGNVKTTQNYYFAPTSTCTLQVQTRTTDSGVQAMRFIGGAPFASATGSNRNSGDVSVEVAAPISGGSAGELFLKVNATKMLRLGDGTWSIGGAAPSATQAWSAPTNHSDARTLDETGATLVQVANALGTLINDLRAKGILG